MLNKTDAPQTPSKRARRKPTPGDRRKLRRILKERYGNHNVPAGGRDWLLALLLCGFRAKQILAHAPCLEANELPALRRAARKLSFEDIGHLIQLTEVERTHLFVGAAHCAAPIVARTGGEHFGRNFGTLRSDFGSFVRFSSPIAEVSAT